MKNAFLKLLFKFKIDSQYRASILHFLRKVTIKMHSSADPVGLVGGSVAPVLYCNNDVIMTIWPIYILVHKSSSRISNEIKN
jgi:hypothetical protein